jgi:thiol-disulfide isomerase/thioredoxin
MRKRSFSLALLLVCAVPLAAVAQSLSIGDPAPPLTVSKWVKGERVDRLERSRTFVVEFWATWCGPCRASIPHLTELQKKFKDKGVTFLGVSVWEQDQEKVEPFVREMGDKMVYTVAMDDVPKGEDGKQDGSKGKMAEAWMKAAEETGIPTAFIVKDAKVAWIGHPMELDKPLEKVVAGDWNLDEAASKHREAKSQQRKLRALFQKISESLRAHEEKKALAALEEALADDPKLEPQLALLKFNLLLQSGDTAAASSLGKKLLDTTFKDDANVLNAIAWGIVDPDSKLDIAKRDLKLAMKAASRANELTNGENPMILDTLALVHFDAGDPAKALELQEKAVKLFQGDNQGMKDRLEQYRKAAHEKGR